MIARWPFAGAGKWVAVARQPSPVPSTQDVLAHALARSAQRGQRVARWRTARRWCYYHAWRHGLPVVLAVLAPSSQHLWQQPGAVVAQAPATSMPTPTPTAVEADPPLRLQASNFGSAAARAPGGAVPVLDAALEVPLKSDKSLHSQEP